MVTIKIGSDAGNYDLNVLNLSLSSLANTNFKKYDWHSDKTGQQTLKMIQNASNYMELEGQFNLKGFASKDIAKVIREVDALTVVEDGHVSYTIDGLKLLSADVSSNKAFAAFLDDQHYKVVGNNGNNVIAGANNADQLLGNGGADQLYGLGGSDKFDGGAGADKLDGGSGNDTLDGGDGKDTLKGGDGSDTYVIDKDDTIVETRSGGTDTISADLSVNLGKFGFVENLLLTGSHALNGRGNDAANAITGNSGANILEGGKGGDTLKGAGGADLFHFVRGDDKDTVLDFDASGKGQDHIDLGDFGSHLTYQKLDIEKLGRHDVVIDFGRGDQLVLKNVDIHDIEAKDFLF